MLKIDKIKLFGLLLLTIFLIVINFTFRFSNKGNPIAAFRNNTIKIFSSNSCTNTSFKILDIDCKRNILEIKIRNNGTNSINETFVIVIHAKDFTLYKGVDLKKILKPFDEENIGINLKKTVINSVTVFSQECANVSDTFEKKIICGS